MINIEGEIGPFLITILKMGKINGPINHGNK